MISEPGRAWRSTSFTELNLGYGASLAMVLLAITFAISWFMFRLRRKRA